MARAPGPVEQPDRVQQWRCERLPSDPRSVAAARVLVAAELERAGRADLADDAALAVSELAANAVLHAHTELIVRVVVTGAGARVEVEDGSPVLPVPVPAGTSALSGRGLSLVAALTDQWGSCPTASGGKTVWFELSTPSAATQEVTAEQLLAAWDDLEPGEPAHSPTAVSTSHVDRVPGTHEAGEVAESELVELTLIGVDAALLLSTRQHSDDLIREMTLLLLSTEARVTDHVPPPAVVRLARRVTAAAEEFGAARTQLTAAAASALLHQHPTAIVRLRLPLSARGAAQRYRDALDEADELAAQGLLLVDPCSPAERALRRWYLSEVIDNLTPPAQ